MNLAQLNNWRIQALAQLDWVCRTRHECQKQQFLYGGSVDLRSVADAITLLQKSITDRIIAVDFYINHHSTDYVPDIGKYGTTYRSRMLTLKDPSPEEIERALHDDTEGICPTDSA